MNEFKKGDRVAHNKYGIGTLVHIDYSGGAPFAVEFDNYNEDLHTLGLHGAPEVKDGHGFWCDLYEVVLVSSPASKADFYEAFMKAWL